MIVRCVMEKNKKTVLYITYVDFLNNVTSGSHVRPNKMYHTFLDLGYDVILLTGEQFHKDRNERIRETIEAVKKKRPDFCYIESPVYPILRHNDRKLISMIHQMGIPIGYFYRDFYRKFPLGAQKRSFSRYVKDKGLDFLQVLTDRVLNCCDIVYFPSEECWELFHYKNMKVLPPAGIDRLPEAGRSLNHTCIYVGGISGHYDGKLLLDAFEELVKKDPSYKLILVCRDKEWNSLQHPAKNADWLEVHHVSGDALAELYRQASVALIIHMNNRYNKYSIPVKAFEYISYGLPIVSVRIQALSRFIESEKLGIVTASEKNALAEGILKLTENEETYQEYYGNVKASLLERNLWKHRVETVDRDLSNL